MTDSMKEKWTNMILELFESGRDFNKISKKYKINTNKIKKIENRFLSNKNFRSGNIKKEIVHILHIGKTGGSAIGDALNQSLVTQEYLVAKRPHGITLKDVPVGDKVVFFLRDPIKRYISGFYSRKRQGKPKYNIPWSSCEKSAFLNFETPNELGKGLLSNNEKIKSLAECSMRNISHVKQHYKDWLVSTEYLKNRKEDILFFGFQESLESDFEKLKELLGVDKSIKLPSDTVSAHKSPMNEDKHLDDDVIDIMKDWYKNDYKIIQFIKNNFFL